ncbi:MAG: hypothetical protein GY855_02635 [candidate division Zixibacteria bacterium]|nr:hypothetical protein [candidate division Zixibacteria bacterium]
MRKLNYSRKTKSLTFNLWVVGVFVFLVLSISACTSLNNHDNSILPNGKFAEGEWDGAVETKLNENVVLLTRQDCEYYYVGFKFTKDMHTGIDLYLVDSDNNRKMLHVSSALGEKDFSGGEWSEYRWGENIDWVANSIGMIWDGEKNVSLKPEGFEFQIRKKVLPGDKWSFRIHLKRPTLIYPEDSTIEDIKGWQTLDFRK